MSTGSSAVASNPLASPGGATPADQRDREEILSAARKKLKNYRKGKKSLTKRSSIGTSSSIASLNSISSSMSSSSVRAGTSPTPSPTSARGSHVRRKSSVGGGSISSLHSLLPRSKSSPFGLETGSVQGSPGSPSSGKGVHGRSHSRSHSRSGSIGGRPSPLGPSPTRATSSSNMGPSSPSPAARPRPSSMSFQPRPSSFMASSSSSPSFNLNAAASSSQFPSSPGPPSSPTQKQRPGSKRHSHRRSLSVSTRRESLDVMLLPGAAAKFAAQEEREAKEANQNAGEVRRKALEALEGKRSPSLPSGWAVQEAERVVLPDLSDDNTVVEQDEPFSFPTAQSASTSRMAKRNSFGKRLPTNVLMSLQAAGHNSPVSSSASSSTSTPSSLSPSFANSNSFGGSSTNSPPMTMATSPRPGVEGFSSSAGLGGIVEEDEEEDETTSQPESRSQDVYVPSKLGAGFGGSNPAWSPLPSASSAPASSGASSFVNEEKKRFQTFSFAKPRMSPTVSPDLGLDSAGTSLAFGHPIPPPDRAPSPPPPVAPRPVPGDRMKTFSFGSRPPPASAAAPPVLHRSQSTPSDLSPKQPMDESSRFKTFSFPRGPVQPSTSPLPSPKTEETLALPTLESPPDEDRTPVPTPTPTFPPTPAKSYAPPAASFASPTAQKSPSSSPSPPKRALRPLTLASPPPASGPRGLRPLSLSSSASSSPAAPRSAGGRTDSTGGASHASGSSAGGPSDGSLPTRYGAIGVGRPKPSTSSSFSSSVSSGSSSSPYGRSTSSPSLATPGSEQRRSSISYNMSPSPASPSVARRSSASPSLISSTSVPLARGSQRGQAKCPTRAMSLGSAAGSLDAVPHARRILSDVGEREEDEEEEQDDDDAQEVTIPARDLDFGSVSSPRDFGTEDGEQDGVLALRERLETVEAERDMLAEDVDGWRLRCKELEGKLAEEKRIGGVERDLARERIRKLGERLASLDSAATAAASAPDPAVAAAENESQARLVSEMRDQVYALASSLARSEEATRAALETVREERDSQERKIAEAVDEDRRIRQERQERDIAEAIEEYRRRSRLAQLEQDKLQTNTPPTPPLSSNSSGGSSNASGSMSRFSFGAPVSRTNSTWSSSGSTDVDDADAPYAPWGGKNGEIDMADFGVVRPLESLVEEEEDDQSETEGAFQHEPEEPSFDESFEISDDNIALGLDIDDGLSQTSDVFNGGDLSGSYSEAEGQDVYVDEDEHQESTTPMPLTPVQQDIPALPTITAPSLATSLAPSLPPIPAPSVPHERRASMVKKWTFPAGPVVTAPPVEAPVVLALDLDEDIKPFAAWVVPVSPNPETTEGRFPSRPPVPAPISTAASYSGVGYNDPPLSAFTNPGTPNRNKISHPNPPSSSPAAYRNFSPVAARASPPISRSAVYKPHHVTVLSSSSAASITSSQASSASRFSFTNLTSAIGSYVNPASPAAVLCSAGGPPEPEEQMGKESGQWVLRAHQASESFSEQQLQPRVWMTPEFDNKVELPNGAGSAGGRTGRFVDSKRQPVPWGSPLNTLDFRGSGCTGCKGAQVIEL